MDGLAGFGEGRIEVLLRRDERQCGIMRGDLFDHVVAHVRHDRAHGSGSTTGIALLVFRFRAGPRLVTENIQCIGMHELRYPGNRRHVGPLAHAVVAVAAVTVFDDGVEIARHGRRGGQAERQ